MKVNDRYTSFYYESDKDYQNIQIDPKRTALLVIDMQNIFVSRPKVDNPTEYDKAEAARWEPYYKAIDEIVLPNNKRILQAFREKERDVIFVKIQGYTKSGRERSLTQKATGYNELLLVPGDPRAEIVPELAPLEGEIVLSKTTDGAVTGTNLRLILSNMGIDTVIITGVLTDQCVSCTVRALADESFKVWLIEDACRAATEEIQRAELTILNNIYCHVINTEELLEVLH